MLCSVRLRLRLPVLRARRREWALDRTGPVRIRRDEHGVPHVSAEHEADLFFGLGFCHAVDRSLQITLTRALGQGRACELVRDDPTLLGFDRFFRRLNFSAGASDEAAKLEGRHRSLAEAYCEGVNRGLGRGRPLEMLLLRLRPEPWTIADCVLLTRVVGYFGMAQSQGDMERLIVEMVQGGVSTAHLTELFPALGEGFDADLLRDVRLEQRLVPERLAWGSTLPSAAASNAWAVAPRRSASGAALLASDPHLEVNRIPPLWYEAVLRHGERLWMGATLPGVPAIVVGRTDAVAWGITYACMDAHDAWVEDCRDGRYRREDGGRTEWVPFRARRETIQRRRNPALEITFYENDHGVLLGDPFEPGLYLAERWSAAHGTGAATLAGAFDVLHSTDASSALEALGRIETAWTFVAADRRGGIGMQMSGLMPARRDGQSGLTPLPGWDPRNDWNGFVSPSDLPGERDPARGYVVAANHDMNHLGSAPPINLHMGPHRAQRIEEVLAGRDDWTVADMGDLQMDVVSKQAVTYMEVLRPLLPPTEQGDILRAWDLRYTWDSRGAYLFERFHRALIEHVFGRVCGPDVTGFLLDRTGVVAGFYDYFDRVLLDESSVWYGDETRAEVFARVAERALQTAPKAWGDHQRFVFANVVLGERLPRRLGFDVGPVPLRGTRATVHQGQIFTSGGRRVAVAASYRFLTDLSQRWARTSLPGGASERRASPWYASGILDWLAGRTKRLGVEGPTGITCRDRR